MTEDTSGRILWTNESKHYLLRLIRDNPIIISPNVSSDTMMKKDLAWLNIEKCFASDGLVCQLGKIKRLWKRMKDNARQNTMKPNDQRKRGIKHVRPPSDLDWQVHRLLATRNDMIDQQQASSKSKKKKPATQFGSGTGLPKMPPNITITASTPAGSAWQHPLKHSLVDSDDERMGAANGVGGMLEDDCDDGIDDDDDCVDLVDLLTPAQQHHPRIGNHQLQHHHHNSNNSNNQHDALEPMTIIEEVDGKVAKTEPQHQDLTLDDDDDADDVDDEYAYHPRHALQNGAAGNYVNEEALDDAVVTTGGEHRALQRELLMQDIQLRQLQRQYEDERMANERQLFRKRSQLLDLQIQQAGLEMKRLQQHNGDMAPPAEMKSLDAIASNADDDE